MEHVFVVKHDIYGYEDNIHESFIEVFCNEDSAKNFFEIKKEEIIQEYYNHTGENSIEDLFNTGAFSYDIEPTVNGMPFLYIDLDEYGFDRLVIQKKDVMSFNIM
jgi:hypothetical protein